MNREEIMQMRLHFAVSMIGGFLGGYAILNYCDVFANAQTANLIHMVGKIFSGDFNGILYMILSLATYMAGNAFFVIAEKYLKKKVDLRALSLAISAVSVVLVGIIGSVSNTYIALLPILFATPVQWNAFRVAAGYVSSTIFSSNNVRQATMSLVSYALDKNQQQLTKTKFYWTTLLSFHIGVAVACVSSLFFGTASIWFAFIPIALSTVAYLRIAGIGFDTIFNRKSEKSKQC